MKECVVPVPPPRITNDTLPCPRNEDMFTEFGMTSRAIFDHLTGHIWPAGQTLGSPDLRYSAGQIPDLLIFAKELSHDPL